MSNDHGASRASSASSPQSEYDADGRLAEPIHRSGTESDIETEASDGTPATRSRELLDYDPSLENVLIAIPAYNEESGIGSVLLAARRLSDNVLVVDDGSSDATSAVAQEAGAHVIRHEENRGKGAAIQTIFTETIRGEYDAVVLLDGDGQHRPRDIPEVVSPVLDGDCDITIGSRYLGDERTETPVYRRVGQKVLDYVTTGFRGQTVSDSQSGFRALSARAVKQLTISTNGMGVESEMINEAIDNGLELREVPIDIKYDEVDGQTYNPLHHGLSVLVFGLRLVRNRHPLVFFGLPGVVLLGLGGGLAIHTIMLYQSVGAIHQWRIALSGFTVIIGILSLFSGLLLSQIQNVLEKVK